MDWILFEPSPSLGVAQPTCDKQRVPRIDVLVAFTSPDIKAQVIAASVAARADMNLVTNQSVAAGSVETLLDTIVSPVRAVIVVGNPADTADVARKWRAGRPDLIVVHVDVIGDRVRFELRDPRLNTVLNALRELLSGVLTHVLPLPAPEVEVPGGITLLPGATTGAYPVPDEYPLLQAAVRWVHRVLRDSVARIPSENGDVQGLTVTRDTVLQTLDESGGAGTVDVDAAIDAALREIDGSTEPLAAAVRVFGLSTLDFKLMALALAPELDFRYQRCLGFLLDDIGRRVGALGLYSSLLGGALHVYKELAETGALARWRVFEGSGGRLPNSDEPLRVDPFLAHWLLSESTALEADPMVRRVLRMPEWPGAEVLDSAGEHATARALLDRLPESGSGPWVLLRNDDPAAWRALLELGAHARGQRMIRVEPGRLKGIDSGEIEESAIRASRMARLTRNPLVIDLTGAADTDDDALQLFLTTVAGMGCAAAVISPEDTRVTRLLGRIAYERADEPALVMNARVAAIRGAAEGAEAYLTQESAEVIATRYPLKVDGLEHAMRLARNRPKNLEDDDPALHRFTTAYKELASEGISHFAERLEPVFTLDHVVLPADRKQQLTEIVDHVRLASQVLDTWRFRDQMPYGRGVTALFYGPSGTGKTMAALAVARSLGLQMLRLDLSRVVSKYIGDTEKNIDRVFTDAQRSGAAILIDEADALLGKRSEVKDAHDRYANIEIAYLLLRMESFEGLAVLTTNMRQNVDPAFLRRLRFIVDFPRPDAEAREQIWRQCLPAGSHDLDDAAFRQIARRIDLTGGYIRQMSLRAAFLAAAAGTRIGLKQIADASRAELAKLSMPPVELDLGAGRRAA